MLCKVILEHIASRGINGMEHYALSSLFTYGKITCYLSAQRNLTCYYDSIELSVAFVSDVVFVIRRPPIAEATYCNSSAVFLEKISRCHLVAVAYVKVISVALIPKSYGKSFVALFKTLIIFISGS